MFTGIITALGTIRAINPIGDGHDMRLVIEAPWEDIETIAIGASIACSGCCLTVVETGPDWFAVDVSAETLSKSRLGAWTVGSRVNLERSLRWVMSWGAISSPVMSMAWPKPFLRRLRTPPRDGCFVSLTSCRASSRRRAASPWMGYR